MKGLFFDIIYQTIGPISLPFPDKWKYGHGGLGLLTHSSCILSSTIWQERGTACTDTYMAETNRPRDAMKWGLLSGSIEFPIPYEYAPKKKKIWDRFSYTQGWPWIYLIGKDNLRFTVLVSSASKCWCDMSEPPFLIYVILGIEPTALCMLVTPITNWITTKGHPFPTV